MITFEFAPIKYFIYSHNAFHDSMWTLYEECAAYNRVNIVIELGSTLHK